MNISTGDIVIKLIKETKKLQYQTCIENNKNKPVSIYKLFQEVGTGKGCRKPSSISSVSNNGSHTEDPTEIADTFNTFFVNVATKIKEPVINSNHEKLNFVKPSFQETQNLTSLILKKKKF